MQQQYVQTAADLAQKAPLTFVVVILSLLLAGLLGGLLWAVWRGVPKLMDWMDRRAAADKEHQKSLIGDVRADAAADVKRSEDAVSGAHREIGQKVDAVHADVRRIALKIGVSVLLVLFAGWLAMGTAQRVVLLAAKCEPPCPEGQKCETAIPRKCVQDKRGKEASKETKTATVPHSSLAKLERWARFAAATCSPRLDENCEGVN